MECIWVGRYYLWWPSLCILSFCSCSASLDVKFILLFIFNLMHSYSIVVSYSLSLSPFFGTYTSAAFERISYDCTTIDKPFILFEYFSGIKGNHYTKAMFYFLHFFRLPNSINMMICIISYFSLHISMFFKMLVCVIIDALAYRSKAQWFQPERYLVCKHDEIEHTACLLHLMLWKFLSQTKTASAARVLWFFLYFAY